MSNKKELRKRRLKRKLLRKFKSILTLAIIVGISIYASHKVYIKDKSIYEIVKNTDKSSIEHAIQTFTANSEEQENQPDIVPSTKQSSDALVASSTVESEQPIENIELTYTDFNDDFAYQVFNLVNDERAKEGLNPLGFNDIAANAAKLRTNEIVSQFSHTRPDGTRGINSLDLYGVSYMSAGENLAAGQFTPEAVVNGWMKSSHHRENILKPSYTSLGVACLYVPNSVYKYYWVQLFVG